MESQERRQGSRYVVLDEERERFREEGFIHLPGVLSDEEIQEIERTYDRFLNREIDVLGKDFCDMSSDYTADVENFGIVNIMLPRRYYPEWQDNVYERRARSIAEQLCGPGMTLDYDQLLAKGPSRPDAVFPWHQDRAYWIDTEDPRTATCWLAIDESTTENGCMRFVSGSHRGDLRPHAPSHGSREESHALVTELRDDDVVIDMPIARGDITVHNERIMHGSGGNQTQGRRRAYIIAFRSETTVAEERRRGFTHSHNDAPDILDSVEGQKKPSSDA